MFGPRKSRVGRGGPPTKSLGFGGFDSSRLLILRAGILMSVEFDRGSPGSFDSRTLYRKTLNRWTGRIRAMRTWLRSLHRGSILIS